VHNRSLQRKDSWLGDARVESLTLRVGPKGGPLFPDVVLDCFDCFELFSSVFPYVLLVGF
jgi:hypothetical protein